MKYLSVFLFSLLLAWTWFVVHSEPAVSFETHADIQNKLADLIIGTIKSKKPQATGILIDNLWTEPINVARGERVKAHFAYRYNEPTSDGGMTESVIKGTVNLDKKPDDKSGLEKWALSKISSTGTSLTFDETYVITTGEAPDSPSSGDESDTH